MIRAHNIVQVHMNKMNKFLMNINLKLKIAINAYLQELSMAKDNKKSQRFFFWFCSRKEDASCGLKGMFCIHPRSFVSQLFLYTQQNTQHTQNTQQAGQKTSGKSKFSAESDLK